jgi:hypothetical protein
MERPLSQQLGPKETEQHTKEHPRQVHALDREQMGCSSVLQQLLEGPLYHYQDIFSVV